MKQERCKEWERLLKELYLKLEMCKCNFQAKLISIKYLLLLKDFFLKQGLHRNPVSEYEPDIKYYSSVVKFICQDNKTEVSVWLFEELRRNA